MNLSFRYSFTFIPLIIFIVILLFLWRGLSKQSDLLPSTLIGKPAPEFHLSNILSPTYPFTEQNFKGHVTLLNVWATWCYACAIEHPMLMEIKKKYNISLYGIVYKDNLKQVQTYLAHLGNPYDMLGNDASGDVAMNFGVYGTPETFVLDKQGKIVHRLVGVMDKETWEKKLWPLIQLLNRE